MQTSDISFKRHLFRPHMVAHAVWLSLRSCGAAKADVVPGLDHWSHKGLNNRAENSQLLFRKRERTMQGHRSPGALQRFVFMHSATRHCFSVPSRRHVAQTIRYHCDVKAIAHRLTEANPRIAERFYHSNAVAAYRLSDQKTGKS